MERSTRITALLCAVALAAAPAALADDKELLRRTTAGAPNILIIFGNSQTTTNPLDALTDNAAAWDGDADSPYSKMGLSKRVLRDFVRAKGGVANFGLTRFASNPNAGAISLAGKHFLYQNAADIVVTAGAASLTIPAGVIWRWGKYGEGPCTDKTVPSCTAISTSYVELPSTAPADYRAGTYFFGERKANVYQEAFLVLSNSARVRATLTQGIYGDAYTDGTLSAYTLGTHSHVVTFEGQTLSGKTWSTVSTATGRFVPYSPVKSPKEDLYFTTAPGAGRQIGFLHNGVLQKNGSYANEDFDVSANCSGWNFQSASAPQPLVKLPRDYVHGAACDRPPQSSFECIQRLLRPQGVIVDYATSGGGEVYTTTNYDHDNPGYTTGVEAQKFADGCDPRLLGAADPRIGLNLSELQTVLTTRNGSQAPIKGLLTDIYAYFTDPKIDGFENGRRREDPYRNCRTTAVILIYDNFNGCQNDSCSFLSKMRGGLEDFKRINVPLYVIGLGASAGATSNAGLCIATNSGAVLPNGSPGYFPVESPEGLYKALSDITSLLTESTRDFASASISSVQAGGEQMAYLATFNAAQTRSIWDGRLTGYRLKADGTIQTGERTVTDPNDPFVGVKLTVPSNDPSVLIWNAGMNLVKTPGTGATDPSAVLGAGVSPATSSYLDGSNDITTTIPTRNYPGRRLLFSLPASYARDVDDHPVQIPIPPAAAVPESQFVLTADTSADWWPTMRSLLGDQQSPPAATALDDATATEALRFIWGDRDAVTGATEAKEKYEGLKLGDIFHSNPAIVGPPANFFYFSADLNGYRQFAKEHRFRRRVLYAGANDGLLHAFDVGVWNRDTSVCSELSDQTVPGCFDLGTGLELFAYAPRATMPVFQKLRSSVSQDKTNQWTVDGAPSAADVFIDPDHAGAPTVSDRKWRTVLVGTQREGSPYQGVGGFSSHGSVYALDVTQPDLLTEPVADSAALFDSPACLDGTATGCSGEWPRVLWEISDRGDLDAAGMSGAGYPDMGETWSKPGIGRVKICPAGGCTEASPGVDRFVTVFGGGFDRERRDRRGNWLYMVDVETGRVLYRANSSCGVNLPAAGCVPFASIPSEPAVIDKNGDGYLDVVYVGDTKGRLWKVDLSDLRALDPVPLGRWVNKVSFAAGSGKPQLVFEAPQPSALTTPPNQFFPIYQRPVVFSIAGGGVGVAFGTGDRDDILANIDPASLRYPQRFYALLDRGGTTTLREADLTRLGAYDPDVPVTVGSNGWYLEFAATGGERLFTDAVALQGFLFFSTFSPKPPGTPTVNCSDAIDCKLGAGQSRFYAVSTLNGNPAPGNTDRSSVVPNTDAVTNPIVYVSGDRQIHIGFMTASGAFETPPAPRRTSSSVRDWKEQ